MAEFKLGRLRFVWQGEWTTGTNYVKDDIVRNGGNSYVCVAAHTAAADFYTNFDGGKWELMSAGLQWKTAPWAAETYYNENDIVRHGGKIYIAINGHTSDSDFYVDFDANQWQLLVDGIQWKTTPWTASGTIYKEGDLVRHGGRVYICVDGHTASASFESDMSALKWQLFSDGVQWKTDPWTASAFYKVGDVVRVSGKTYICINEHTADATQRGGFYTDYNLGLWQLYTDGNQYRGVWTDTEYYWIGDFVRYGAKSYVCTNGHEASVDFYTDFDGPSSKWDLFNDGQQWVSSWAADQWYKEGDIVNHGGTTYICLNGHQSTDAVDETGFDVDLAADQWEIFATGYDWKSAWTTSTYYKLSDIVRYGAKAYVAVVAHTSAEDFYTDVDAGNWQLLVDGTQWKTNVWQLGTIYKEGDLVRYGGRVYICVDGHQSTSTANRFDTDYDAGKWQLFSDGSQWKTDPWTASDLVSDPQVPSYYKTGDIVKYGGKTYIAINDHQASDVTDGGFYDDAANWQLYADGTEWKTDWSVDTYYKLGDIVRYDGNTYLCIEGHTSAATIEEGLEADLAVGFEKWTVYAEGFKFKGDWTAAQPDADPTPIPGTKYNVNDVVKFGGSLYICVEYHVSDATFAEVYWNILVGGLEFEDTWNASIEYQIGDIVTYGGYSYVAIARNDAKIPPGFPGDWELLTTGFKVKGEWSATQSYKVGEVVKYGGSSYVAIVETGPGQKPVNEEGGVSILWEVVAPGFNWRGTWSVWTVEPDPLADPPVEGVANEGYRVGDTIRWIANTYVCIKDHVPLETSPNQPDNDSEGVYWQSIAEGAEGNTLTRRGDLVTRDATRNKRLPRGLPGQVLQVDNKDLKWDYFNVVDKVYYVTLDGIDSPERGTSLQTSFRTLKYATEYVQEDLANRAPATIYVKTGTYKEELPITVPATVAIVGDELRSTRIEPAIGRGIETINMVSLGAGYDTAPTVEIQAPHLTGGDTAEAYAVLGSGPTAGKVVEIVITKAGSGYTTAPTVTLLGGGYSAIATATATIKTKLYTQTNMFLLRDATGLRNMTLNGLDIPLGAANQYLTKRPSGDCAYVSLDAGTGPGDESTWITTRSPYVQNVTTYGSGAVGMKVDGALHNGGYKTMVCNDYTQVISDGIGIWCTNQGRVEAVSVFTYYAHLGYLSEDGGVIRGTNGNCSYGTFGVSAEGVDPSEISRISRVNNRKEEAQIINTFVDGDGIVHLEYSNAGKDYDPANTTFTFDGNGVLGTIEVDQVVVQDGGVYEVRVMEAGKDWLAVVNNGQDGTEYTIRLSASDVQVTDAYKGERIVIIDGQGVGQYGYITYFNGGTKVAVVAKESFTPLTITGANGSNELVTTSTTSLVEGQAITLEISGSNNMFGGLDEATVYYVKTKNVNGTSFTISDTYLGTTKTLTSYGGGDTMTLHAAGFESFYGQPIETLLDTTTRYTIEPRVVFSTGKDATATGEISKGLSSISRSANGGYFQAAPTVIVSGTETNATGATATATITGTVESVRIREGGSGFEFNPTVTFVGGGLANGDPNHAAGQAVVTGKITAVSVTNGGSGYNRPPLVQITGGLGDAYISAKTTKVVGNISVNLTGSGYTEVPTITLSGGGGTGAEAVANLDAIVTGFTILEGGTGYTAITTTVQIVPAAGDNTGAGAEATIEIDNGAIGGPGVITDITLVEAGSGYTKPPLVIISSTGLGAGAEIETSITGSVASVTVVNGGSGYTSAPSVQFSSGTASAIAYITGSVNSLEIINGGTGFTTATLEFVPVSDFVYDETLCSRDVGIIVDAVTADATFNTNYRSVAAGLAYLRSYSSVVLDVQKTETIAAINKTKELTLANVTDATARTRIDTNFGIVTTIINGGSLAAPALAFTDPTDTDPLVITGAAVLRANRTFIRAETIAWINTQISSNISNPGSIWFGFSYDSDACSRDVGYLVDALSYDLLYGGNSQTQAAGLAYRSGTQLTITGQVDQTVAAFNFIKGIVDNIIINDIIDPPQQGSVFQIDSLDPGSVAAGTTVQGLIDVFTDIVTNGSTSTTLTYPDYANGDIADSVKATVDAATPTIKSDVIAWINATYIGSGATAVAVVDNVVQSITITDAGTGYTSVPTVAITGGGGTGALGTVILNGTVSSVTVNAPGKHYTTTPTVAFTGGNNFKSLVAGLAYYKNASSEIAISNLQLTETLAAIEYIKDLTQAIATNTAQQYAYQSLLTRSGSTTAPAGAFDQTTLWIDVIKAIADNGASNAIAAGLIDDNHNFIIEEVSQYADDNFSLLTYTDADLRKRIGLIIDAVVYDLTNGTVERTLTIGQQYSELISGELAANIELLTYVRDLVLDIILNVEITKINTVVPAVDQVFAELLSSEITSPKAVKNCFGLLTSIVNLGNTLGDSGNNTYANLVLTNKSWIQAEVIEYVKNNYVYFEYNQTKCERDVGLILDAVGMDLALGTNFNAVTAGQAYLRSNASIVKSRQVAKTLAAIKQMQDSVLDLADVSVDLTASSRASSALDIVYNILRYGSTSAPALDFVAPTGANQDSIDATAQLQANRAFIVAEITAWIEENYPVLAATYDSVKCARDVGLIVDALSYDILYGGNSATRTAAQAYFVGTESQLGFGEAEATSASYQHLQTVVGQVVQGTAVTPTTGNAESQDFASGNATATEATTLDGLVQIIIDVIDAGSLTGLPSASLPNVSWADAALQTAKTAITTAKASITTSVTTVINSTTDFTYNETLCARDVGLIIDAITHDVVYAQDAIPVATATTTNVLSDITVDTGGEGYGQGTTVSFSNLNTGTLPVATPIITSGVITGFNITNPAGGFTSAPTVTITADTGSGAFARAYVLGALVQQIRIIHPGSGYNAPPFVKLVDPNNTIEGRYEVRVGDGVLDQPTFVTRGEQYLAAATTVESPTGYADTFQVGEFVYVQNLTNIPTPGANIQFEGNDQFYKLVTIRELTGSLGLIGGRSLITANKEFVKRQIIAYINSKYPLLDYNETLCARDVGLIIDAIVADAFGDTERGIEAGKSYFRNASSLIAINEQYDATLDAINQLEDYLVKIVQNIDIPRNQLYELQVKEPGITGGSAMINPLKNTLDIIRDIIDNGNTIYAVQDLLLDNKAYIQAEVMAFIATTYPDFVYNETLCRRDVGLIVDALGYDLFAGLGANGSAPVSGLARSREAGLRYYSNASAQIAIVEQFDETVAAINQIGVVALAVVNNVLPSVVYQSAVTQILNPSVNVTLVLEERIQDGIDEIVNIITNGVDVLPDGTYSARLQVSPPFTVDNVPSHNAAVTIRSKYSQVRLTNHDFLNVGTGNKAETNYPGVPVNAPEPENEVLEAGGGRCFYTSTDQDGNFRVGELFAVEQATGIATLNADAFNLSGLNELTLGGINIGGTGATITEFSTDSLFFANSDSIVPTQKAIKTYIASQLGSGGGNLAVNAITAGDVAVTGNEISTNFPDGLDLIVPNGIYITETVASTDTLTGSLVVDGGVGIADDVNIGGTVNVGGSLVVNGDFTVNGDLTTLSVGSVSIEDINITIAKDAANAAAANGAGITVNGPAEAATITYANADDSWNLNKAVKADSIQNTPIGSTTANTGAFTTLTSNGATTFTNSTTSTGSSNGAVVVTGGVGIGENLNVGAITKTVGLQATGSVDLSPTDASVQVNSSGTGGVVISPTGSAGLTINPTAVGTINNVNIGGTTRGSGKFTTLESNGKLLVTDATASTSVDTGALQVDGGVGINGAVYAGSIQNTPIGSTTANTGAFTTLTASNTVTLSPAGKNVTANPTQGGIPTTAITSSVSTITVTHGTGTIARFTAGDYVSITGATPSAYNGTWLVATAPSDGTFTIASTLNPGTATVQGTVGYGTVVVRPTGGLSIAPSAIGTVDNVNIGGTTRGTAKFTTLDTTGAVTVTGGTTSSSSTTGQMIVTGGVGISENLNVGGAVVITGNLTVNGTTTTVNSTTISVDDINIELGSVASPTDTTANGGGITLLGTSNKTLTWVQSTGYWTFNQPVQASSIQNTPVGSSTANTGAFTSLTANAAVTFTQNTASTSTTSGTLVVTGGLGVSGRINASDFTGTIGANTANTGAFTTLTASSTVTLSPSNASIGISPTGTGTVTLNPATAGTINNMSIGATTRASGAFTTLSANSTFSLTDTTQSTTTSTGALVVSGGVGIAKNLNVGGTFSAVSKSFLIDHPTKDGYKLQYGSLEGPENGVYVRGKVTGGNVIELPDYWTGLVDEATITVNLTAIGSAQALYVEKIENNKVYVGGGDNFFYTVYGERKDVDSLTVEYKA